METNRFKEPTEFSDLPKVFIDRNGEHILSHGHHRTAMASILGIESIPVRVGIRHQQWQEIRAEIATTDIMTALNDRVAKHQSHPDVKHLL